MALTKITRGVIKANENYDTHNINSTGIVTAVSANFTGNVSIGGTLTYQDVTNIDSVGVITARAGVKVPDSQKIFLGTGDDLQIYHDGNHSQIKDNGTGNLQLLTSHLKVLSPDGSETYLSAESNGPVQPYHNNVKKLETTLSGVAIHEDTDKVVRFTGAIGEIGDVTGFQGSNTAGNALTDLGMRGTTLRFATGSAERLRITSAGVVNIGDSSPNADGSGALNVYSSTSGALSQFVHSAGNGGLRIGGTGSGSAANLVFSNDYNNNSWVDEWTIQMHGSDDSLRFLSGGVSGTERIRISSDGALFVGEYSGSGRFVLHNADQSGGADTTYSKDKGLYVRNDCGPTHVDLTGVDNFTAKIHNGAYAGSGVADPQGSISKLLLHGVTYNGYNAYGAISLDVQGPNHGRGDLVFLNGGNNTSISERLRITGGGTVKIYPTELQTTAGDKFAQIRGGGIINTKRLATGHFGNTAAYQPQQLGYIGDYMHYGCNAVYYIAQTSTGNSGYSSHMFSWYDSGHWGHYGKFVLMCHEVSYIGGMCHRFLSGTSVSTLFSIGQASGASTTSTQTGSGTHSGQSVTRYDCTVSHSGTYRTVRWYLGLLHGLNWV